MLKEFEASRVVTKQINELPNGKYLANPIIVADNGQIFNLDGTPKHVTDTNGYYRTYIRFMGGTSTSVGVHQLVYYAFNGVWSSFSKELNQRLNIDHINGNRHDNRLENLQLLTHGQNIHKFFSSDETAVYKNAQLYNEAAVKREVVPLRLEDGTLTDYMISVEGWVANKCGHHLAISKTTKYPNLRQVSLQVNGHSFQPSLARLMLVNFGIIPASWGTNWRVLQKDTDPDFSNCLYAKNLFAYPVNTRKGNN